MKTRFMRSGRTALAAVALMSLVAASCGSDDDSSGSGDTDASSADTNAPADTATVSTGGASGSGEDVRLLVAVPLTGDSAETGEDMVHGAELAAAYINENGGIPSGPMQGAQIVIESADDEMSTEASTTIASRFVDDESIWTMLGFLSSGQAQAAALVADRAGLGIVSSFSCADFLTSDADNIAVVCGSLSNIARAATDFAISEFDATTVGSIAGDYSFLDSYYAGIDDQLEVMGATNASRQVYSEGTADFSTYITNLESSGIDVMMSGAFQADAGRILSQTRQAGIDLPYVDFLGEGWGNTFFETAGDAATQDAYVIDAADTSEGADPFVLEMSQRFEDEYGKRMPGAAMHSFDSVLSIAAALEAGASTREELIEYMHQATGDGLLGPIDFTDELRPESRVAVMYHLTGTTPNDREVVARYDLRGDETVERIS